ncbi:MAG: hypothetical protein IID30_08365 [Planctomycetes bacterium]|nr:hypothetical protein [Planctomycetota bacterium]
MTEILIATVMVTLLRFDTGKYGAHDGAMRGRDLDDGFPDELRRQS